MKKVFIYEEDQDYSEINIVEDFTHIRAFHGTRTNDLDSFYTHGIKPLTKDYVYEQVYKVLRPYPTINDEMIAETIEHFWSEPNWVWFTITKSELVHRSGHYLLYGSELINAVISNWRYREELKNFGESTMFSCDVPLSDIEPSFLNNIIEFMRENISLYDLSFKITGVLAPVNIVSHEYPTKIYNPY